MREDVGYTVKAVSDHKHKELVPEEVLEIFQEEYINREDHIKLLECHFVQESGGGISTELTIEREGQRKVYHGKGNGRLDAVSNAIMRHSNLDYSIFNYEEHALRVGSNSDACAYVAIQNRNGKITWGAGVHDDIITASVKALISAINRIQ